MSKKVAFSHRLRPLLERYYVYRVWLVPTSWGFFWEGGIFIVSCLRTKLKSIHWNYLVGSGSRFGFKCFDFQGKTGFPRASHHFSGLNRVLPSFTEFYWGFTRFYQFFRFYQVLLGFTEFYWILPSFTGFYRVLLGFYRVLLGFTEFYWVLPSFSGFYWVLPSFNRFLPSFTGFYRVLLGSTEF